MADEKTKRPRGCFFYGCISGAVLLVLVLLGALLGLHYFKKMFNELTDIRPVPLPSVHLSQAELDQLQQRVEQFRQEVSARRPTPPLTLTADEINALMASDPGMQSLKDKLFVSIEGDQLKGQISVRLDELGLPIFKNRYLNASASFAVGLTNGNLSLRAQEISVKGKPIPAIYMDKIRMQNLAEEINQDTNANQALGSLEGVKIQDGKLVIEAKAKP